MSDDIVGGPGPSSDIRSTHLKEIVETIFRDLGRVEAAERTETVRELYKKIDRNFKEVAANLKQSTSQSLVEDCDLISPEYLDVSVSAMALAFSRYRKIQKQWGHSDALDVLVPSTSEEMLNDLLEARAHVALTVLKGVIPFTQVAPDSYEHLEAAWLRRVKAILAYFYWRAGSLRGPDGDFDDAGSEIRSLLLGPRRSTAEDFDRVESYLMDKYLAKTDLIAEPREATQKLIQAKAHRIWQTTGEPNPSRNWFRARLYVKLFYENIIGAVRSKDEKKTAKILEAFEFSKSSDNRFLVINAFEAAIAIEFLDKSVLGQLKNTPAHNLNMVSVGYWPQDLANRKSARACGKSVGLRIVS